MEHIFWRSRKQSRYPFPSSHLQPEQKPLFFLPELAFLTQFGAETAVRGYASTTATEYYCRKAPRLASFAESQAKQEKLVESSVTDAGRVLHRRSCRLREADTRSHVE